MPPAASDGQARRAKTVDGGVIWGKHERRPARRYAIAAEEKRRPRRCARRGPRCRSTDPLGGRGFFGLLRFLPRALGFLIASRRRVFRPIKQRDEGQRSVVTLAEPHLQDSQVATVALCVARAEIVEKLA